MARNLDILVPTGGIARRFAYQSQKPYTTIQALNYRPYDTAEQRRRAGPRPGMRKLDAGQAVDGANPALALVAMNDLYGRPLLVQVHGNGPSSQTVDGRTLYRLGATNTAGGRVCATTLGNKAYFMEKGATSPQYFDTSALAGGPFGNTPTEELTLGQVPTNCSIVAACYGRLGFGGDMGSGGGVGAPRTEYWSRRAVPNDFDFTEEDADAAWSDSIEPIGNANDVLTAIVPWYGDYCLHFFKSSVVLQVGDLPGGRFFTNSTEIGNLDAMSWCYGPDKTVYFLSGYGLAKCDPGNPRAQPQIVSDDVPLELRGLKADTHRVALGWNVVKDQIEIGVTALSGGEETTRWTYDLADQGYWPSKHASACRTFCVCQYPDAKAAGTSLLWGCSDGYLRIDADEATTDDGTALESELWIGPLRTGDGFTENIVNRLTIILDRLATERATEAGDRRITEDGNVRVTEEDGTGGVSVALHVGDTAQDAFRSSAVFSVALQPGRNLPHRPRRKGAWAYLRVYGDGASRSLESIALEILPGGEVRR